jgi:hypothetical protein
MPTPTPSIKIAAKAKSTRGVNMELAGLEVEKLSLSLGGVNLDLRFIVAYASSTLRGWGGVVATALLLSVCL